MRPFFSILLLLAGMPAPAQKADTIAELPAVLVLGSRMEAFGGGSEVWKMDPETELPGLTTSLGSALPLLGPFYVKSYGPGQLSSLSLRGAGASHTALIWNGFNLQNPMHGQIDFSLVPAQLFGGLSADLSANGALWGSGAIGGAIHLGALPPEFQSGHALQAGLQAGAFHQEAQTLSWKWGGRYLRSQSRVFRVNQRNDFAFRDLTGRPAKQSHAAFRQMGGMQDLYFQQKNHQIDAHVWVQESEREIPPTLLQASSEATQEDRALRLALHWQYTRNLWAFHLRSACFYDFIDYRDPLSNLMEISRSRVVYAEGEARWSPKPGHLLGFGLHRAWLQGETENYLSNPLQQRLAVFGSYRVENKTGKWTGIANLRQEWMDGRPAPPAPSLHAIWKPLPWLQGKLQWARYFRWPTQNDLYWSPGGNPHLLPEKGWGGELGFSASRSGNKVNWETSLGLFSRRIEDWILWRPGPGYWSPQNLALVWSRGLDGSIRLGHDLGPVRMHYFAAHAWVWSTAEKALSPNDNSLGKQLIYTPRHTSTGSVEAAWSGFSLTWTQRFQGKVYTLSDQSAALPAYGISDIRLEYTFNYKRLNLLIFSNLYNILNANYQVVEFRPMPGRSFELGIIINFP